MANVFSRAVERFGGVGKQEEKELREGAQKAGCTPISSQRERDVVTVHGQLRCVTLRPRAGVSALEAELYDGSGTLVLVWLGRRRIAGIDAGRQITVHGRLGSRDGEPVMYNPRYELTA